MKPYDVFVEETDLKIKELLILFRQSLFTCSFKLFYFCSSEERNYTGSVLLLLIKTKL